MLWLKKLFSLQDQRKTMKGRLKLPVLGNSMVCGIQRRSYKVSNQYGIIKMIWYQKYYNIWFYPSSSYLVEVGILQIYTKIVALVGNMQDKIVHDLIKMKRRNNKNPKSYNVN